MKAKILHMSSQMAVPLLCMKMKLVFIVSYIQRCFCIFIPLPSHTATTSCNSTQALLIKIVRDQHFPPEGIKIQQDFKVKQETQIDP